MKIDLDEDQVRLLNSMVRLHREILLVNRCRDTSSLCDDIVAKLERALDGQVKNRARDHPHVVLELHKTEHQEYAVTIAGHGQNPKAYVHEDTRQKAKNRLRNYLYDCLRNTHLG